MAEVARRHVREREELHAGLAGDERGLAGCGVPGLPRALALVGEERRLVHEEVRAGRGVDDRRRRRGVAGEDDLPARARLAENVGRRDDAPVGERHALAALEKSALTSVRHAEPGRLVDVEPPGTLVLDEGVADRGDAVVDRRTTRCA